MPANPVLSNRALMLAKVEATYNVDSLPVPGTDAYLISNCDVKIQPNVLKRNFYKPSLSPLGITIGRKLASVSFDIEVKGSGVNGVAPKLGELMKGCGFARTQITASAASEIQSVSAGSLNTGPSVSWAKTTVATSRFTKYRMKVGLGGASTTAKFITFGNPPEGVTTVFPRDEFSATVMGPGATTTVTVDSTTDPLAPTYLLANCQIGDVIVICVGGVYFKRIVASAVEDDEATAIATLIDADGRCSAAATTATVTVTLTGGVSGAITSGTTAITLGQSGAQVTPTWTGNLVKGDVYEVEVLEPGYHYTPISSTFQSFTIYAYYDGTLHRLTGCMGTFTVTAQAGNYATAQFTFTGQYHDPEDEPLPTNAVFETSQPQQVELAQLLVGGAHDLCAQQFTLDMGISLNPRECVSNSDGYNGVNYTSREPKGGANPEMAFESEEPFWRNLAAASFLEFHARVGTVKNNVFRAISHSVQLSNIQYADRNNLRVYDLSFSFASGTFAGDDEIRFVFPQAA